MSAWIGLDEAIRIVESALGREKALERLEHRIWEAQVSTKTKLVELWGEGGRTQPTTPGDRVLFTRLAIRGLVRAATPEDAFNVERADLAAGDISVNAGDTLICVFGLRVLKSDVCWAFDVGSAETRKPTVTAEELVKFIRTCGTENSKEAYRLLRARYGCAAPKRDEVFMPEWKRLKGNRSQGRPRKSPS
jgi:hypothetical protein